GLTAACALALPAAAARAATGSPATGSTSTGGSATGSYAPNPHEWWLDSSHWNVQQKVWPVTEGAGVTVAVVDGGVQASNPDLPGVVEPGADMLGYPGNGEHDYKSNGGHGTEMAELIAGQGTGDSQFGTDPVGIAPRAKILPVHVVNPSTSMAPVPRGIRYAVDHGASVINISLGWDAPSPTACDPSMQQAVAYALAHDVVVVAAAGNTNQNGLAPQDPSTCAGVLAVGGVVPNGSPWKDSTPGPQVSVAAPAAPMYAVSSDGRQSTLKGAGTSSSTALVSGAAALIRSRYPKMPWYQVDQRLIGTAIPDGPRPNNGTGYGIIDVSRALNASAYPVSASSPDPPYARYQSWLKTPAGQSFARANHINTGNTGPGKPGAGARPGSSSSGTSSSGSSTPIIIGVIAAAVIAIIAAAIVLATRNRPGHGPGGPRGSGGPGIPGGGYQPGAYAPPGQYPQAQPQYPPPGQPQYPPGQHPPPGQYQPGQHYPPPGQ
ncbi:MAG: S8 family serine peptidase, partial [Nocardiopsaceae bacterium]|nr:S8 family serine peptidase [Nocardiopsaceae bacterium]